MLDDGAGGGEPGQRTAARSPRTTVTQTVPSKSTGNRSAITGRYISAAAAARHPNTSITEGR